VWITEFLFRKWKMVYIFLSIFCAGFLLKLVVSNVLGLRLRETFLAFLYETEAFMSA